MIRAELNERPGEKAALTVAEDVNPFRMFLENRIEVFEKRIDLGERMLKTLPVVELVDDINLRPRMALKFQQQLASLLSLDNEILTNLI